MSTTQQDMAPPAPAGSFVKAFLPGLMLGLLVGLFLGAIVPLIAERFVGRPTFQGAGGATNVPNHRPPETSEYERPPADPTTPTGEGAAPPAGDATSPTTPPPAGEPPATTPPAQPPADAPAGNSAGQPARPAQPPAGTGGAPKF